MKQPMSGLTFDECDRQKVITGIEKHFGVTLEPDSGRRKFLEDRSGKTDVAKRKAIRSGS